MLKNKQRSETFQDYTTHSNYYIPFLQKFKNKSNKIGKKGIKQILFNYDNNTTQDKQMKIYYIKESTDSQYIQKRSNNSNKKTHSIIGFRTSPQSIKQFVKLPSIKRQQNCKRSHHNYFKRQKYLNSNGKTLQVISNNKSKLYY